MSFQSRFQALSLSNQKLLTDYMNDMSMLYPIVIKNLKNEDFLEDQVLKDILDFFLKKFPRNIKGNNSQKDLVVQFYQDLMHHFATSFYLGGGSIHGVKPQLVSTILVVDKFRNHLWANYGDRFLNSWKELEEFLSMMENNTAYTRKDDTYKSILIKPLGKVIWSIWHPTQSSLDPLSLLESRTYTEVERLFGLPNNFVSAGSKILVLTFETNKLEDRSVDFFRPTICDLEISNSCLTTRNSKEVRFGVANPKFKINNGTTSISIPQAVSNSQNFRLENLVNCFSVRNINFE